MTRNIWIGIVVVILVIVGYFAVKNPDLFQVKVETPISSEQAWNVYKNSVYGFELSYPSGFIVEEDAGDPYKIHFGSTEMIYGNIFVKIYDTNRYNIRTIDDISYTNKGASDTSILSSRDSTNGNGIKFREMKTVQNPSANAALVLFIHGNNAYELDWACWPSKPCFDDATLGKMVQSIKFSN